MPFFCLKLSGLVVLAFFWRNMHCRFAAQGCVMKYYSTKTTNPPNYNLFLTGAGLRHCYQAAGVPRAQRQLRGLEQRVRGDALLLRQQHAQHQGRRLPPAPAEDAGLCGRLCRLQDLLPPRVQHDHDWGAAELADVPVSGAEGVWERLHDGLPGGDGVGLG